MINPSYRKRSPPFPSTHWSSIVRAAHESDGGDREALGRFAARYLPVMRTYLVKWRGLKPEEADDCLQGFIADRIIEKGLLALADPNRGRFRSFLLVTLNNYFSTVMDRESRLHDRHKRLPSPSEDSLRDDPARAFNVEWAQSIVEDSLKRMKQECEASGRAEIWKVLEERILLPAKTGRQPASYETLVHDLNLKNPIAASNLLVTAKRSYSRVLRSVIGEYAVDAQEVESELIDLRAALAHAGSSVIDSHVADMPA